MATRGAQELLPQVKAILILDEDGGRVSCKYHDKKMFPNLGAEAMFEHKLFRKTKSVSPGTAVCSGLFVACPLLHYNYCS